MKILHKELHAFDFNVDYSVVRDSKVNIFNGNY